MHKELGFAPLRRNSLGGFVGTGLDNNEMLLLAQHDRNTGA